jgi:hypothetical protein
VPGRARAPAGWSPCSAKPDTSGSHYNLRKVGNLQSRTNFWVDANPFGLSSRQPGKLRGGGFCPETQQAPRLFRLT